MRTSRRLASVVLMAIPVFALGARITLQDGLNGYSGARDTWLNEDQKSANYGGTPYLSVEYNANGGGYIEDCTLVRFMLPTVVCESVTSATLELFYVYAGSMLDDNVLTIKPYRVIPTKDWYENTRNGQSGEGANWRYFGREEVETNKWTYESGGWYDKIDDGNSSSRLKKAGGIAQNAIEPPNWVPFTVTESVRRWVSGTPNNGFILFSCGFEGGGTIAYVHFASRETNEPSLRPKLHIQYTGAEVVWTGHVGEVWDIQTSNWLVGGVVGCFDTNDNVWFTDRGHRTNVQVSGVQYPARVVVSNDAKTYTFLGGTIGGTGIFSKTGTGMCRLACSNAYQGATYVDGGVLAVLTNWALGDVAQGTYVSTQGTLTVQCAYAADEPLFLSGMLSSGPGDASWAGPVTWDSEAQVAVQGGSLELTGPLGGTGTVRVSGSGMLVFSGGQTSSWRGAVVVDSGRIHLDRSAGPAWIGGLSVANAGAATVQVWRANQFAGGPVEINTNGHMLFSPAATNYVLTNLVLRGGSIRALAPVGLADRCTVEGGAATSRLSGTFRLQNTNFVFDVAYNPYGHALAVEANLMGGGIWKRGTGSIVLLGTNAPMHEWRIENGSIVVASAQALGDVPVIVGPKQTLAFSTSLVCSNRLVMADGATLVAGWGAELQLAGPVEAADSGCTLKGNANAGSRLMFERSQHLPGISWEFSGGGDIVIRTNLTHDNTFIRGVNVFVSNWTGSALGTGTVYVGNNGVLAGYGLVDAKVVVEPLGRLEPGGGEIGRLVVSNNVTFQSNSVFLVQPAAKGCDVLDLEYGGRLTIDTNAALMLWGQLVGTQAWVIVENAQDIKGHFANLPEGGRMPLPNENWFIHYQPNAIYFSRYERPVAYFRTLEVDGETLICWRTVLEWDVVGFDLYREETPGMWVKMNTDPIPAEYPRSGGAYEYVASGVPPGQLVRYQLVQLFATGASNTLITCQRSATPLRMASMLPPDKNMIMWDSREDETYWIQTTTNLFSVFEDTYGPIEATPPQNAYTIDLGDERRFIRIRLER